MNHSEHSFFSTDRFIFLRHGETDWNLNHKFQGQIDIPLNETGRDQALACRPLVDSLGIQRICSSPLLRAYETAKIVSESLGLKIAVEDGLMECGSKEAAVTVYSDLGINNIPSFTNMETTNSESPEEFLGRSLSGLEIALSDPTKMTLP